MIDAPFLNLTPGSRMGVVHDERLAAFVESLAELEAALDDVIRQQQQAAEERANRDTLKAIQRAFREALLALPEEEYDWFEAYGVDGRNESGPTAGILGCRFPSRRGRRSPTRPSSAASKRNRRSGSFSRSPGRCSAFAFRRPLARCPWRRRGRFAPSRETAADGKSSRTCASSGRLSKARRAGERRRRNRHAHGPRRTAVDPACKSAPRRATSTATAEALVTVTDSLLPERPKSDSRGGLPEYTFEKRPGELWRSRYNVEQNVIVINNGHRDFVYAARNKSLKLRYVCRLFAKELVVHNFPGYSADELLERMIELLLYTEENLR